MNHARFRFYAELNDFLTPARRFAEFRHEFPDVATGAHYRRVRESLPARDRGNAGWKAGMAS